MLFIKCYSVSYMYDALFVKDWRLKKKNPTKPKKKMNHVLSRTIQSQCGLTNMQEICTHFLKYETNMNTKIVLK